MFACFSVSETQAFSSFPFLGRRQSSFRPLPLIEFVLFKMMFRESHFDTVKAFSTFEGVRQ